MDTSTSFLLQPVAKTAQSRPAVSRPRPALGTAVAWIGAAVMACEPGEPSRWGEAELTYSGAATPSPSTGTLRVATGTRRTRGPGVGLRHGARRLARQGGGCKRKAVDDGVAVRGHA
jgi:hypothetical protein